MGASCAPSYACLHLGWWERQEVYHHPAFEKHVALWVRFIDDVLVVWRGTTAEFEKFMSELNNNTRNIFITFKVDREQIEFLDLMIRKEGRTIVTNTFRKPTAGNTLLHATSHHPWALIRGIPIGQFLRIRRNCTQIKDFHKESKELGQRFRKRGYPNSTIRQAKLRAVKQTREKILGLEPDDERKGKMDRERVGLVTTYGTHWDYLRQILGKHWHLLMLDNKLKQILGPRPNMIAKRAPTIGDTLVHSEYTRGSIKGQTTLSFAKHIGGMHPCGHCSICKYVMKTNSFKNSSGKNIYKVKPFVNCSTTFVVYQIICPCGKIYVGKTIREFRKRIGQHISSIIGKDDTSPVAMHFMDHHESVATGMQCMVIYKLELSNRRGDWDKILQQKEAKWIFLLDCMMPKGLNSDSSLQCFL
ncbi:uncharacterized protein LOC120937480 [Rana temporaria]|uniref:uncharacterized protein LOC120937480 n=1 Tax=Rana temporaria TaxID=8407 RepID=UPI001AADAE18|nr:uncharacterized protein LOC120937480 [Rana temporaria]